MAVDVTTEKRFESDIESFFYRLREAMPGVVTRMIRHWGYIPIH